MTDWNRQCLLRGGPVDYKYKLSQEVSVSSFHSSRGSVTLQDGFLGDFLVQDFSCFNGELLFGVLHQPRLLFSFALIFFKSRGPENAKKVLETHFFILCFLALKVKIKRCRGHCVLYSTFYMVLLSTIM